MPWPPAPPDPIPFGVQGGKHMVVPVRFARAVDYDPNSSANTTRYAEFDTPELDTRGYEMGTRPSGWSSTDARGPMLGLMRGADAVKVRVVREMIAPGAPLRIVSTNPAIVEIASQLDGDDHFTCRGLDGEGDAPKIQVRLGADDGPVLAELEPHVFSKLRVPLTIHNVRLDGAAGTGTAPSLTRLDAILARVNKIWRPCGIEFGPINRVAAENHTLPSNRTDTFDDNDPTWSADMVSILGLQRTRLGIAAGTNDRTINIYVIRQFALADTLGYGISRDTATSIGSDTGIVVKTQGINGSAPDEEDCARTIAHEIGHFLRVPHVENRNSGNAVRYSYGLWQLMWPSSFVPVGSAWKNFGNGRKGGRVYNGHLVTLKNLNHHSTDGECQTARNSIRAGNWM